MIEVFFIEHPETGTFGSVEGSDTFLKSEGYCEISDAHRGFYYYESIEEAEAFLSYAERICERLQKKSSKCLKIKSKVYEVSPEGRYSPIKVKRAEFQRYGYSNFTPSFKHLPSIYNVRFKGRSYKGVWEVHVNGEPIGVVLRLNVDQPWHFVKEEGLPSKQKYSSKNAAGAALIAERYSKEV